ncbi:MAG TPA: hypothetical protein VL025_03820, partial [Thermoanaerobaculia bacterium]|nr:hypothetical protein [Thermoanaerobaculia bacterium]
MSAQGSVLPPPSIEFLDRLGAETTVVPENGTWRVRVVDPERDYYSTPDILPLETTSAATGDQESFTLWETGPSTGVFEGVIESATGPPGFGNSILETATGSAPGFQLDTVQIRSFRLDSTYLTATATVAPSITALVDDFGNKAAAYTVGHPVRVRVEDHNLDSPLVVGTTTVQLTTLSNDLETLVLTETGAATQIYEGSLPSNTGPTFGVPGDGAVQLIYLIPDFVTAVHADANGGTQSSDVAGSNNGSIVFLDEHGGPPASLLEGSRARLRVYEYLGGGGYPPTQQTVTATLASAIGGDQQTFQLWETGPATGVYEGWIPIEPAYDPGNYQLFISRIVNGPGSPPTYDTLTASYMPYDGPLVTATAQVTGFAEIAVIDEDGRPVEAVPVGDRLRVRVRNPAEKEADFVIATVRSPAFSEREPMALFRTAAGSDVFEG